jgi:hypothetical protein
LRREGTTRETDPKVLVLLDQAIITLEYDLVVETAGLEITRTNRLRALGFETFGSCGHTNSLPWRGVLRWGGLPGIHRVQYRMNASIYD